MRGVQLALLVVCLGGTWARLPPHAAQNLVQDKIPPKFEINYGLQGIVTQEHWDKFTVFSEEPPTIVHPNLNNCSEPTNIVGKTMLTIKNRSIYAFQGIYYAAPPVGRKYRFKRPDPAGKYWSGNTLTANHTGFKCPQHAMFGGVPSGNENCLNLNVYTPHLPSKDQELLPVMMFIHGGAFISGDSSLYLPTKLLDHEVILVVIHYRLGNLGFFSLDNDDAPGNAGLWDQIEALKWIQDNIEGFGGDKDRVTIFGESAGSASVNWLLLLPEAEGLFHGVIGESGSALEHWSHDPDPIGSSIAIGEYFGCDNFEDLGLLYECMVTMDADYMAMKMSSFVGYDRENGEMGFRGAAPVTQGPNVSDEYRLIDMLPIEYFTEDYMKDIPLMIGANKHEGSFVLGIMYTAYLIPKGVLDDPVYIQYQMLDDMLNAFGVNDDTHGISESLQDAYVKGLNLGSFNDSSPGLVDMAGVFFLKAGAWRTAKLHSALSNKGTYFYSFDYESDDTMFRWLFMGTAPMPFRPGVTHADELMYLFSFPAVLEGNQTRTMERMVKMWTNFAIYGNPTPVEDEALGIPIWPPVMPEEHHFMLIQDELHPMGEYPERWHIALEEDGNVATTPSTIPPTNGPSWNSYNDLASERDAYMISMIVFVVAAVCLAGGVGYLVYKKK